MSARFQRPYAKAASSRRMGTVCEGELHRSYSQKRRPLKTKQVGEARTGVDCRTAERRGALARCVVVRGACVFSMLMSTNFVAPLCMGDIGGEKLIRQLPPGPMRRANRSTHPSQRTAAGTRHTAATADSHHAIPMRAIAASPTLTPVLTMHRSDHGRRAADGADCEWTS
jgi:hypothetical protein